MAFSAADKQYLHTLQSKLTQPLPWRFARNQRPESDTLGRFPETWQELFPAAPIPVEAVPETQLPGLVLGDVWHFHALPDGKKLEMLGEILLTLDGQGLPLPGELQDRWQKMPLAPELTIFIAPQCPFCPQMVRQLLPLTVTPPRAAVTLIDASLFLDLAREQDIKAVPTVIVNGVYRLTGAFSLTDLLDLAEKTDPAHLPASVLERMLVEGQAGMVGEFMLDKKQIFPNFLPLLTHTEINVRLGAMVALETVGELEPALVAEVLPEVWRAYPDGELAVQGDIVYLIGTWGEESWLEPLAAALARTDEPDLQEALEEALETIRDRTESKT